MLQLFIPGPLHRTLQHEDHRLFNSSHGHHQRDFQLPTHFRKIRFPGTGSRRCGTGLRDGRNFRLPYFHFLYLTKTPDQTMCAFFVPQTRGLVNAHRTENGLSNHGTKTVVIRDMVYIFHAHRTHGRTPHSDNHHRT